MQQLVYYISRRCFSCFVFDWYWKNKKPQNSSSLIRKKKNDKKKVLLTDYSKPLKQQKSYSCVLQPNLLVLFLMSNNWFLLAIVKIKTNLKLAYAVNCALLQTLNIKQI